MKAKELILEFITMVFLIALIIFCLVFFIFYDYFKHVFEIIKAMVPIAFFGIIFLIKIKLDRAQYKRRKQEQLIDITLYLTYSDKIKSDIVIFGLPILLLVIAYSFNKTLFLTDIINAIIVSLAFYLWQLFLFNKHG